MGNAPKVTIFLWSYNHAKYLRDTIESLLHQTFTDFVFDQCTQFNMSIYQTAGYGKFSDLYVFFGKFQI